MVSCINLEGSIPEKQIFSLVFDKSIRILYSTRYEKVIILGDFNIEAENNVKTDFL